MEIQKLRYILAKPESEKTWNELIAFFNEPSMVSENEMLLAYANEHLENWSVKTRLCRNFHPSALEQNHWPLVRMLTFRRFWNLYKACAGKSLEEYLGSILSREPFQHIQAIEIPDFQMDSVSVFAGMKSLQDVNIHGAAQLNDFSSLPTTVQSLDISARNNAHLDCLALTQANHVQHLTLRRYAKLSNIQALGNMKSLRTVHLDNIPMENTLELTEQKWHFSVHVRCASKLATPQPQLTLFNAVSQ